MAGDDSSRPLASATGVRVAPDPSDLSAVRKANPWTDVSLPTRMFPFTVSQSVGDRSLSDLRTRAVEVLARSGYPVVLDSPAVLPLQLRSHPAGTPVRGIVVGEHGLRIDVVRRKKALRNTLVSVAVLAVGIAINIAFFPSAPGWGGFVLFAIGLVGALTYGPAYGTFDSEVAYCSYSALVHSTAEAEVPLPIQVTVGVARVASANWASKSGSGRNLKAVVPDADALRDVPSTILAGILG